MKKALIQKVICITSVIGTAVLAALLIGGIVLGIRFFSKDSEPESEPQKALTVLDVRECLLPASDLVTMKDQFDVMESYQKSRHLFGCTVPLTTDETFIAFTCSIGIGFDLSEADISVDKNNRVEIVLPEPRLVYNEILPDSRYTKTIHDSVFSDISAEEIQNLEVQFQQTAVKEHLADGTAYREATRQAAAVLYDVLEKAGITDVQIT